MTERFRSAMLRLGRFVSSLPGVRALERWAWSDIDDINEDFHL